MPIKSREDKFEWKSKYFMKLLTALDEYDKFFIVGVDNVGWVEHTYLQLLVFSSIVINIHLHFKIWD